MKLALTLILLVFSVSIQGNDVPSVAAWAGKVQPLTVGSHIPNVILWTVNGDPVHLSKLVHQQATVVIFYQGGWSPFCSDQLDKLKAIANKLTNMGFKIVAISPDSPTKLIKSREQQHLNYQLLSDYHLEASQAFGLAYRLTPDQARDFKKKYGAELRHLKGEEMYNLPVPGVFILDIKGKIHFQYVNPDYKTQLSSALLLEAAKMVAENTRIAIP